MFELRRTIAVLALLSLAGLIVWTPSADRLLLLPLLVTTIGIARGQYWSRWMALAIALAVLPWATVVMLTEGLRLTTGAAIAFFASLLLLGSLLGRLMLQRYEGSAPGVDWTSSRMALVRWTLIFNLASLLNLYPFVAEYRYRVEWHIVIPALTLLGLLAGLWLLARQKTAGLLIVALCGLLFLPAGGYFIGQEATYRGEAVLFATLFLPGILAAGATLSVFAGDMYRYFRNAT
jgi:hypothetical protein